jgi:hypothetical protein
MGLSVECLGLLRRAKMMSEKAVCGHSRCESTEIWLFQYSRGVFLLSNIMNICFCWKKYILWPVSFSKGGDVQVDVWTMYHI